MTYGGTDLYATKYTFDHLLRHRVHRMQDRLRVLAALLGNLLHVRNALELRLAYASLSKLARRSLLLE